MAVVVGPSVGPGPFLLSSLLEHFGFLSFQQRKSKLLSNIWESELHVCLDHSSNNSCPAILVPPIIQSIHGSPPPSPRRRIRYGRGAVAGRPGGPERAAPGGRRRLPDPLPRRLRIHGRLAGRRRAAPAAGGALRLVQGRAPPRPPRPAHPRPAAGGRRARRAHPLRPPPSAASRRASPAPAASSSASPPPPCSAASRATSPPSLCSAFFLD